MKNSTQRTLNLVLIFLCPVAWLNHSPAQTIEMGIIETAGDKVIVHYKLDDPNPNHLYAVSLYSSKDNFIAPLTRVKGDVGTEVKPGSDNKIIWDITSELGAYKGKLTFEIRGRVFIPFVKLTNTNEGQVFKRTKNYPVLWTSGNLSGQVNIELFQGQERIWGENNLPNSGKYDWFVPGSAKKGSNYVLKFTNAKDRNDFVQSKPFTIKPKIPFMFKAAAMLLVGGGIAVAAGGGAKGTTNVITNKEPSFPTWPTTPN